MQQPWVFSVPEHITLPLCPAEALVLTPGNMKNNNWEKVATLLFELSVNNGVWCGIAKPQFVKEIYRKFDKESAVFVQEALEQMIEEGMLEVVENHHSWYSKFALRQYNYIVCPTFALLDWIWMRQLRKLPKAVSF